LLALEEHPEHKDCAMPALSRIAKTLLPKRVKRFVLLHILGGRRLKDHIRLRGSRIFLERDLMPWVATRHARVLFVGTGPYTYQIENLFRRSGEHYTTIDPERSAATWGARNHIVGSIAEIGRHRPNGHFDCIVLNGVFGFGIDQFEDQRATVKVLHDALVPGGTLLVGWNTNLTPDLDELDLFKPYFTKAEGLPWPHRTLFPLPETHVYDFYTRRED